MTKSLFVGLFFAALYPGGLLWSLCSFIMCFWVDKYCLFRLWKQPPAIDASLTIASRLHIAIICIFHGVISNQVYAGFPFISVIPTSEAVPMTFTVDGVAQDPITATLYADTDAYKPSGVFHVATHDEMSDDQKSIVTLFSVFNIIILVLVIFGYFGRSAFQFARALFKGDYNPVGDPNPDLFSFVPGIDTYVPSLTTDSLPLPLLCCDLRQFDVDHIAFTADFAKQDVTQDSVIVESKADITKIFSQCKQYKSAELLQSEGAKKV
jgi:hypothetical protein